MFMAISAYVWIVVCWKSLKPSQDRRMNNFCVRLSEKTIP